MYRNHYKSIHCTHDFLCYVLDGLNTLPQLRAAALLGPQQVSEKVIYWVRTVTTAASQQLAKSAP